MLAIDFCARSNRTITKLMAASCEMPCYGYPNAARATPLSRCWGRSRAVSRHLSRMTKARNLLSSALRNGQGFAHTQSARTDDTLLRTTAESRLRWRR